MNTPTANVVFVGRVSSDSIDCESKQPGCKIETSRAAAYKKLRMATCENYACRMYAGAQVKEQSSMPRPRRRKKPQ